MSEYESTRVEFCMDNCGDLYAKHVSAMTSEHLHFKSDIAAELAYRDHVIQSLQQRLESAENPWVKASERLPREDEYPLLVRSSPASIRYRAINSPEFFRTCIDAEAFMPIPEGGEG